MSGIASNTGLGCKIEAELWRKGKLIQDDRPKPTSKLLVIKRRNGLSFIEFKPKEKT